MTQNGSSLEDDPVGGDLFPASNPSHQLPRSSRAFEMFMSRATLDTMANQDPVWNRGAEPESPDVEPGFPRPSYLEGSQYLARLEAQERNWALLQKDSGTMNAGAYGLGSRGKATAPPTFHRGIAHDVVERIPGAERDQLTIDPLPSRWATAREDKAQSLEVSASGLEVKYTGSRNHHSDRDHDASAIRADHPMPLQCGLYYFEVNILTKKHTE